MSDDDDFEWGPEGRSGQPGAGVAIMILLAIAFWSGVGVATLAGMLW